jgi:hypothetical protein
VLKDVIVSKLKRVKRVKKRQDQFLDSLLALLSTLKLSANLEKNEEGPRGVLKDVIVSKLTRQKSQN